MDARWKALVNPRRASRRMRRLLAGLALLALALFLLGRFDNPLSRAVRARALDLSAPVIAVTAAPLDWLRGGWRWVADLFAVHEENRRLRREVAALEERLAAAQEQLARAARLEALLAYRDAPTQVVASGRLVAFDGGPFQESALLTVGRRDGVRVGDAVVAEGGLVGRIIEAGSRASRVLLVTDLNSRIPVRLTQSGARAIAAGRNAPTLALLFLPEGARVRAGEVVVTSGADGIFAPDIPIGRVVVSEDQALLVEPAAAFSRLDHVAVVAALRRALLEDDAKPGASEGGRP